MRAISFLVALSRALAVCEAQSVYGTAECFAAGITGGGDASPIEPADIDELKELLTSADPGVIILSQEYDFIGSEGETEGNACLSWGSDDACQNIISNDCGDAPSVTVTYDTAEVEIASCEAASEVAEAVVMSAGNTL
ncbi:hypothetical protein FQN54_004851 [Arachnomyces sp. PD_36]|nr:hypothetical protein FQN54_004851 [Arachnomyces sp. PD_36]